MFISYSHDSAAHNDRVLEFANVLRSHGVNAEIDRYEVRPPKGWPHWCAEQLEPDRSAFVLMICTEIYKKRIQDKVPANEGRGVFWEGSIIHQYIYNQKENTRFIPILFDDGNDDLIPPPLRGHARYRIRSFSLTDDEEYESLYRELTGRPKVTRPSLGPPIDLGDSARTVPAPLDARPVQWDDFPPITHHDKAPTGNSSAQVPAPSGGQPKPPQPNHEFKPPGGTSPSGGSQATPQPKHPDIKFSSTSHASPPKAPHHDGKDSREPTEGKRSKPPTVIGPAPKPSFEIGTKQETPVRPKPPNPVVVQIAVVFIVMLLIVTVFLVWKLQVVVFPFIILAGVVVYWICRFLGK